MPPPSASNAPGLQVAPLRATPLLSVVGTSLFQILFVTMVSTMTHALTTKAVDIVLAGLLLLGSVLGAQFGTQIAMKARPEVLRLVLAAIVIAVALRMLYGLGVQPDEIYTVSPL